VGRAEAGTGASELSQTHELQENTAGRLQLGCSTLVAFLLPTWLLLTALILQFVPELRGIEMFDPATGQTTWVEYGVFRQWFWGGLLSLTLLQVGVPVLGQVVYVMALGEEASTAWAASQARRYEEAVGPARLPVPLVVKKRVKGGARAAAVPVEVVGAGLGRRLLARTLDTALLVQGGLAGLWLGHLLMDGLSMPGAFTPWMLGIGGVVVATFFLVRWRGALRSGSGLGKAVAGIEVLRSHERRGRSAVVVLRTIVPDVLTVVLGLVAAVLAGVYLVPAVLASSVGPSLDPGRFGVLAQCTAAVLTLGLVQVLAGLPAVVGDRSLYDRVAGTWVARSELVARGAADEAVMTRRIGARLVDGAFVAALVSLPLLAATATGGWVSFEEQPDGEIVVLWSRWLLGVPPALLVGQLVHWVDLSLHETTMGKRLFGLSIVDAERDGPAPWFQRVVVREVVCVGLFWGLLPIVAPAYDLFTGWSDPRQRTLHDWIAGTRVVRTRRT
jgi:uncharacterized RDD family membrane protein YckC